MIRELKPIQSEADYEVALAEVERLWGADSGTDDGNRLDVLATLIEVFETAHFPIDPPDPVAAILFRMQQKGLAEKDLEPLLGGPARTAEILGGKRGLSLDMIRRIHAALGISADVLIRPTRREEAA